MIARLRGLGQGGQLLAALVVAALVGALITLAPAIGDVGLLLAIVSVTGAMAVLTQWAWQHHHGTDWSNSFSQTTRPRGTDARIHGLTQTLVAAQTGDVRAQTELHGLLTTLATERLRERRGTTLTLTAAGSGPDPDHDATRAALGPELTAYLTHPPTTRPGAAQVGAFITTLEEL